MKSGTLFSIGVGPGDPGLITVRGAEIISSSSHIFVPISSNDRESVALRIARPYIRPDSRVYEILFPMSSESSKLEKYWNDSAQRIAGVLQSGNACFLTLGDPMLYSTNIYLVRALRKLIPDVTIETIPGVPAFCAVSALTDFPVGEAKRPVTIIPTSDSLDDLRRAIDMGGTVVIMKIGNRLLQVLKLLDELQFLDSSVLVSYAGMSNQCIETDLRSLLENNTEAGYLSIILIDASRKGEKL